ncbi:MAG: ABC transporter permease [Victivallaceae bacterium]|nr:ABC transporter permease [Victivallaceae bacterium]
MTVKTLLGNCTEPVIFIGRVASAVPLVFTRRGFRVREFLYYLDLCGARSVGIVLMICFLMGGVIGVQAAIQLQKVGSEIFSADLIGFSVLKEFGPLMVAMIATGRAGSAFAAEIGTMQVDEEVSALATMGIRPEAYLVLPKLIAMIIALPVLTVFGDAAGVFGGMLIGVTAMGLPAAAYWGRTVEVLNFTTFALGALKSVVFAVLITMAGCYCGFRASNDALGVGRGATSAVVSSIFLVVVADAVITVLYSFIGY